MGVVVNHHNRSQTAGTKAGYRFNGKAQIFRCFPRLDAQFPLYPLQYLGRSPNVAGRTLTDPYYMPAPGFEVKLGIKGSNTINLTQGQSEMFSYLLQYRFRQVAENILGLLQDRY